MPITVNAPRGKSISEFRKQLIDHGGIAKANRFLVRIAEPAWERLTFGVPSNTREDVEVWNNINDLTFQCEATEVPGRTLSTMDVIIAGPTFKMPYQTAFTDLQMTFLCTNDMYEKRIFDSWMRYIINDEGIVAYRNEYATKITIFQFDEGGDTGAPGTIDLGGQPTNILPRVTYAAEIQNAFPIAQNGLQGIWGEEGPHRLTVTFAYTHWIASGQSKAINIPTQGFVGIGNLFDAALSSRII